MFEDGTDFEDTFDTPQGQVSVFAMVHLFGTHLVLEEVLFYATEDENSLLIGVRRVLEISRAIRMRAKQSGFANLTIVYHRTGSRIGPERNHSWSLE